MRKKDKDRKKQISIHDKQADKPAKDQSATELGGPKGPEPTRYGDWERRGRCIDF